MKVDKIRHYQSLFINHIEKHGLTERTYMYEAQSFWQTSWDIESLDLQTVYDKALTSTISGRLWGGSQNSAKESMLAMLATQKEFIRSAFRDLFAIDKDLGLRCDRFLFYCNEAIKQVSDSKIIDHKHDRSTLCMYLSMAFPELYTLYDYHLFKNMMVKLESRNIPTEIELERYQKSMKAIHTVMFRSEGWTEALSRAIGGSYLPNTLLVMYDFADFVEKQS